MGRGVQHVGSPCQLQHHVPQQLLKVQPHSAPSARGSGQAGLRARWRSSIREAGLCELGRPTPRAPALLWATEPGPARGPSLPVPISVPVQYGITRLHVGDAPPSLVVPLAVCPTTAHMAWLGQLPVCSQNTNVHPGDVLA